jgi:hypothetical protein
VTLATAPSVPAAASDVIIVMSKQKCGIGGCPGLHPSPHLPIKTCDSIECNKNVHRVCYEWNGLYIKQRRGTILQRAPILHTSMPG